MSQPVAGVCQICGCTENKPCVLWTGDPCAWLNRARTLCNQPSCVKEHLRRQREQRAERRRTRQLGPFKVLERRVGKDGLLHPTRIAKRRPDGKKRRVA